MSSMECDLQKRPGEFTFTWSIHNYSYWHCTEKENEEPWNEYLCSPDFLVEFLGGDVKWTKWYLILYPKGFGAPGFISCYMLSRDEEVPFNFELSIRKSNGQFKGENVNIIDKAVKMRTGFSKFASFEELLGPDGCLVNDTLTIRCRMWQSRAEIPVSVNVEAHSRVKVSRLDYTWVLDDISASNDEFKRTNDIKDFFIDRTQINLLVFRKGSSSEGGIYFGMEMIKPKKNYFWVSVVNVIDSNGRVAHSARGEHLLECSDETLVRNFLLISNAKCSSNKKFYLPNNSLTLQCELSFATDKILETFLYTRTKNELDEQSNIQGLWIKNMQHCYMGGKFSDFVIRTPDRQFPANRTILSAHSEVFDAMFERNMKERKTGMVDIDDLDGDTVLKMLEFIYTGTLHDIDCSSALKLYFAADKYRITTLLKKCSTFLMSCLDASNVCDILEFADTHQDDELKSRARDFVNAHVEEIVVSDAWKKLTETNSLLTSEILQWIV